METRLRQIRIQRGFSFSELARAANLGSPNLNKLEKGSDKAGPRVRSRVATALAVSEEELFDSNGWPLLIGNGNA